MRLLTCRAPCAICRCHARVGEVCLRAGRARSLGMSGARIDTSLDYEEQYEVCRCRSCGGAALSFSCNIRCFLDAMLAQRQSVSLCQLVILEASAVPHSVLIMASRKVVIGARVPAASEGSVWSRLICLGNTGINGTRVAP